MKNRKLWIIICASFVIIAASVSAAALRKPAETGAEVLPEAAQTKTLGQTELVYRETKTVSGEIRRDIYTDGAGNEYWFDADGHIMLYSVSPQAADEVASKNDAPVAAEKAKEVADEFAASLFGEVFSEFSYDGVSENAGAQTVIYTMKDGIVTLADVGVTVTPDGGVQRAVLSRSYYDCAGADVSGITEQTLLADAEKQLGKKEYALLGGASLINKDGKPCVMYTVEFDGETKTLYYGL